MVGGLNQDLRYALPRLGRSQAFAAVADCVVRRNRSSLAAWRTPTSLGRHLPHHARRGILLLRQGAPWGYAGISSPFRGVFPPLRFMILSKALKSARACRSAKYFAV